MKVFLVLAAAVGIVVGVARVRAGRNEAGLWHEATVPVTPAEVLAPPT